MPDVSIPAHLTVTEEVDLLGLPILTADFSVSGDAAEVPLPGGQPGDTGPRGRPRATFIKVGQIANQAARPTGLTADDRGKWWHRIDSNGMDVWCGDHWSHSPDTVGVTGPVAPANTLTPLPVNAGPKLTKAAAKIRGSSSVQTLEVTPPAGEKGIKGLPGASGEINTSPDMDQTTGPTTRSTFAWARNKRSFRPNASPNGFGPWSLKSADFVPLFPYDNTYGGWFTYLPVATVGTLTIPPLPFAWRPLVFGSIRTFSVGNPPKVFTLAWVRMGAADGQIVATGLPVAGQTGFFSSVAISPMFGDPQSKNLSPTSKTAIVPAWREMTLFVNIEAQGGPNQIGWEQVGSTVSCFAQPVNPN